jgi:ATP-dependent Clp protease ATP-binding subunit ClpA
MSKERSIAARIAIFALSQVGSAVIATARSRAEEMVQQSNLEKYTLDLTAAAKAGELDPVVGRDAEIGNVISVLNRFTGNNPLLVGEGLVGFDSGRDRRSGFICRTGVFDTHHVVPHRSVVIGKTPD